MRYTKTSRNCAVVTIAALLPIGASLLTFAAYGSHDDWMLYLGGAGEDRILDVAAGGDGSIIVVGQTASVDFAGRLNQHHGGEYDAFVAKLASQGELLWMVYLGGSDDESARAVATDGAGNIFLCGTTASLDFEGRTNEYHGERSDSYIAKVSPSGMLEWMTYLGGSGEDTGLGIALYDGSVFTTGVTRSTDFEGRINEGHGSRDAYVCSVASGGSLQWMRYLGGNSWDQGTEIVVNALGQVFVSGWTMSFDFEGRINENHGTTTPHDAFVVRTDAQGDLDWMAYLGGTGDDRCGGMSLNALGEVFVTGTTDSVDFDGRLNLFHGFQLDAFVAKVDAAGPVQWMRYLGGLHLDEGNGVASEGNGAIWAVGRTASDDFDGRMNDFSGWQDGYLARMTSGGGLKWMLYLGGSGFDSAREVISAETGHAIVVGYTGSTDFEHRLNSFYGELDGFVLKVQPAFDAVLTDLTIAFGTLISGGLPELIDSDDAYLIAQSRIGFTANEPNIVDLRVGAESPLPTPQFIDLSIEGRLNQVGGTAKVRLRNWATNSLQQVHQYPIGNTEAIEDIANIDAMNRVRGSDGRIELSLRQSVLVTFSASGFRSFTDWVGVSVRP